MCPLLEEEFSPARVSPISPADTPRRIPPFSLCGIEPQRLDSIVNYIRKSPSGALVLCFHRVGGIATLSDVIHWVSSTKIVSKRCEGLSESFPSIRQG